MQHSSRRTVVGVRQQYTCNCVSSAYACKLTPCSDILVAWRSRILTSVFDRQTFLRVTNHCTVSSQLSQNDTLMIRQLRFLCQVTAVQEGLKSTLTFSIIYRFDTTILHLPSIKLIFLQSWLNHCLLDSRRETLVTSDSDETRRMLTADYLSPSLGWNRVKLTSLA